jgi:SAM-dependent methyltransferase
MKNEKLADSKSLKYSSQFQKIINFFFFPYRAFFLHPIVSGQRLLSLRDERFAYVAQFVHGRVLDVGCGPYNAFIRDYCSPDSIGVDFFKYPGLEDKNIIKDPAHFPFPDSSFDCVTLIANINHIPEKHLQDELSEISRVIKVGGRIVLTRIGPVVSFLTHEVAHLQSKISDKYYSMDHERGMEEDERLSVPVNEIDTKLGALGFRRIIRHSIKPQWCLNEVLVYEKK